VELNYNQDGCATLLFVLIYQYVKRVRALRISFSLLLVVKAKQKVDSLIGWATPTISIMNVTVFCALPPAQIGGYP